MLVVSNRGPYRFVAEDGGGYAAHPGAGGLASALRPLLVDGDDAATWVAAALSDSPVGQLAYSELFESFGNGTSRVTPDQVLEQVSLYWLTNTAAGSVRFYYEEARAQREPVVSTGRLGVAVFEHDFQTIRPLAERDNANIQHWSEHVRGGHFAVLENPDAIVADLREFFG